ncbi:MAG: hypothetical protein ACRYFU_19375 [Janthinobacterium lividum]
MPPKAKFLDAQSSRRPGFGTVPFALSMAVFFCAPVAALAQTAVPSATAPASIPAGADSPVPLPPASPILAQPDISPKEKHEAEDAFLQGARALDHKNLLTAEQQFTRASKLNPQNRDYALALAVTREHRLTELVQQAAVAQKRGHVVEAEGLLTQARAIDPENAVVRQHFQPDGNVLPFGAPELPSENPVRAMRAANSRSIGGPIELTPRTVPQSIHARGGTQEILRAVCNAYGLKAEFDSTVTGGQSVRLDLENASFEQASRVAQSLTHTFLVPLQPGVAFFAKDTPDDRAQYQPLVEETLFMPGMSADSMTEYANMARNIFDLKVVNAVGSSSGLVIRGDQGTVDRVNATFADLLDGGADVLLELNLYEIDTSHIVSLGAATPSSVGVFPVAAEAESLISANQSLISAAIASGQLVLTSNPYTNAIEELGLLLASGTVSSAQFSNLLGVFGSYAGLPLAGVFLGSTTTFSAMLTSSDVRILDTVQLRAGNGQDASFRAGTRYPIETGIYSSGVSSSLTSAVAGLSIGGTSVSSLLSQYLGSTSASVPQIQFEDLGLTLKATPQVLRSNDVSLKLDFKIEALGSGTINTLPILNNRSLTSQVTIPAGQTALLASIVNRTELRSIDGLPFLSELPGFQGTEKNKEVDTTELLITLTPHVVRNRKMEIASRRLLMPPAGVQHADHTE